MEQIATFDRVPLPQASARGGAAARPGLTRRLRCAAIRLAAGDDAGALLLRRLLPLILLVPATLGGIEALGADFGWWTHDTGEVMATVANALVLVAVSFHLAGALKLAERSRVRAERRLTRANRGLAERVAHRTRALQVLNRELEAFAYSVSHDLRTPLRAIDGFSRLLLDTRAERLDPEGRRYLERVRAGAQRMGGLIDDLLALSRVSRVELRHEPLDLAALARDTVAELRAAYPEREVEFAAPERLMASGDPRLVRILLANLLGNAWKFTAQRPRARVELGADPARHAFYVRDDGAGFNPRYVDKLFVPFQRLHPAEQFPGSGIGLATVARVAHRHGGQVWAASQEDAGATFYFTLSGSDQP